MVKKLNIQFSEESLYLLRKMEEKNQKESYSGKLRKAILLEESINWISNIDSPCMAFYGNVYILNEPAKKRYEADQKISDYQISELNLELERLKTKADRSSSVIIRRLYNALVLKPTIFGVGIDLKKLWEDEDNNK